MIQSWFQVYGTLSRNVPLAYNNTMLLYCTMRDYYGVHIRTNVNANVVSVPGAAAHKHPTSGAIWMYFNIVLYLVL